jgi:archaeosine-15-forming tRNA-guanine transglycosylase
MLPDQAQIEKDKAARRNQQQKQIGDLESIIFNEDFTLQEQYDKGLRFVEQMREAEIADLAPAEHDQLISVLEGKVDDLRVKISREEAGVSQEVGRQISDLIIAAKNDLRPKDEIIEEANQLYDAESITYQQRASIINAAMSQSQAEINKAESIKRVSQSLQGDESALPTQKDVDTFYDENRASFDESPNKTAAQAQLIDSTRQVPTRVKSEVEAALYSGDLNQITNAIDLIDRVDNIPGMFDALITPNQKALALQMTTLAEVMPIEQAAIEARKLTDPRNTDRINAARQAIKDEKYPEKYPKWTDDALGDMPAVAGARATRQFGQLFELYYTNGMTESQAKAEAEKAMTANWKESPDFGFMQYRPEDYYAVNGQTDYIKDQLYIDVTTEFQFPERVDKDDIFLVSDDYTAQTAATGKPAYIVMVRQANGELTTLQDRDGSLYYTPDQQAEIEKQREIIEGKFKRARAAGEPMTAEERRLGQLGAVGF